MYLMKGEQLRARGDIVIKGDHLQPYAAASMARDTPVLPAVPSVIRPPGTARRPCSQACDVRTYVSSCAGVCMGVCKHAEVRVCMQTCRLTRAGS